MNTVVKMQSCVLFSVLLLSITINTKVLARPTDNGLRTKRSGYESFSPRQIKFPTEMREGFRLVINGSFDIEAAKTFETTIKAVSGKEEDHCRIKFNLESNIVEVTPTEPETTGSVNLTPSGPTNTIGHPTFSLTIEADNGFNIFPKYNDVLSLHPMKCLQKNYNNYAHVEFSDGLHSISTLSFHFDVNSSLE